MQTDDIRLMLDLGVMNPRADQSEAFFVWAKLGDDPAIVAHIRKLDYHDPRFRGNPYFGVHDAVAAMTDFEKACLNERVRAAYAESIRKPTSAA